MTLVTIYDCFLVIFTYLTLHSHRWEIMGASEIRGQFDMTNSEGTNSRMTNLEGQFLEGRTSSERTN